MPGEYAGARSPNTVGTISSHPVCIHVAGRCRWYEIVSYAHRVPPLAAERCRTSVATIAEVEVDRETGRVWVRRIVCAHDCGLVINPAGLRHTVECGMLHGLSRALWEEVRFDEEPGDEGPQASTVRVLSKHHIVG